MQHLKLSFCINEICWASNKDFQSIAEQLISLQFLKLMDSCSFQCNSFIFTTVASFVFCFYLLLHLLLVTVKIIFTATDSLKLKETICFDILLYSCFLFYNGIISYVMLCNNFIFISLIKYLRVDTKEYLKICSASCYSQQWNGLMIFQCYVFMTYVTCC